MADLNFNTAQPILAFNLQGGAGDKYFIQAFTALAVVVVIHNLNKYPSITIFDSANDEVEGDVIHNSVNQLTAYFSAPFTGKITCN